MATAAQRRLEFSEFRRLCSQADFDVNEEEAKEAVKMLDKRGSGYVEFDEFVAWFAEQNRDTADTGSNSASPAKAAA